jgi:uncharacterized protein involved in cysteine biosynthesis
MASKTGTLPNMLSPALRALDQMTDPVFLGVVLHSVVWSLLAFVLLSFGVFYEGHSLLAGHGWLGWAAGALGAIGTAVMSLWLFLPLATAIASLFVTRITNAVEARWYPGTPPGKPATIASQAGDSVVLGLRVLAMQAVALVATLIPPYVTGLAIGWLVASWAVGRGLFVPVAMMRMDRVTALRLYRSQRTAVVFQGALITAAGMVPILNLFAPVLGAAAMVHLLHRAMGEAGQELQGRVVAPAPDVLGQHRSRPVS